MKAKRLVVSFSGGETSALMTHWILNGPMQNEYDDIKVIFANTGEEREETLEFVRDCDVRFGFGTIWIEAVIHHNLRKGPTARVVNFNTATRKNAVNGPFEQMIQKYGIPNSKFKHCTRTLKQVPIESYLKDIGWKKDYDLAIGIRSDEIDRVSERAKQRRIIYPLVSCIPTSKPQVNSWWEAQSFRLRLKGYEGNCAWCWKKSMRKLITLMRENPNHFDFPARMESAYSRVGPEFLKNDWERSDPLPENYRRNFFRGNKSVADISDESRRRGSGFIPAVDDHVVYEQFDPELDVGGGCEESCEVFSDEDYHDPEC